MLESGTVSLGAVILAAGSSSRMGRPKMLLPWRDTTILGHLIRLWTKLPASQVAVVHAAADTLLETELNRLEFPVQNRIANPAAKRGMFSSIQCAANWPGWNIRLTHWAIILGDQPHLRPETLSALANLAAKHPKNICQPGRHGRPRHPILLPREVFKALENSTAATLKEFLQPFAAKVKLVEADDPGLDLDLDHPADYEKALKLAASG